MKNAVYFFLLITVTFIAEYLLYVFFTSDKHVDMNGVYNEIISVMFLFIFFFKEISLILSGKKKLRKPLYI
jgi:hypothetical protein